MLYIQFSVNKNRYAISAEHVVAVVPLVALHTLPKVPDYVSGLMNYHGESIPVVDVTCLMEGRTTKKNLSTRIVLVSIHGKENQKRIIGLMAERLTEFMRIDESRFRSSGVKHQDTNFLGDVVTDSHGLLQRLSIDQILPVETQELLFT